MARDECRECDSGILEGMLARGGLQLRTMFGVDDGLTVSKEVCGERERELCWAAVSRLGGFPFRYKQAGSVRQALIHDPAVVALQASPASLGTDWCKQTHRFPLAVQDLFDFVCSLSLVTKTKQGICG